MGLFSARTKPAARWKKSYAVTTLFIYKPTISHLTAHACLPYQLRNELGSFPTFEELWASSSNFIFISCSITFCVEGLFTQIPYDITTPLIDMNLASANLLLRTSYTILSDICWKQLWRFWDFGGSPVIGIVKRLFISLVVNRFD